jgi:hypothetical protein
LLDLSLDHVTAFGGDEDPDTFKLARLSLKIPVPDWSGRGSALNTRRVRPGGRIRHCEVALETLRPRSFLKVSVGLREQDRCRTKVWV